MLDKAIRDLDRERMGLQNQEKKLVVEIKKAAKQGQMVRRTGACCSGCSPCHYPTAGIIKQHPRHQKDLGDARTCT